MNHKAELTKVKVEWLDRAFEEARKRLHMLAGEADAPTYKEFLTRLVEEGAVKIKGSKFTVQSNNQGSELLRKNLKAITKKISEEKGEEIELQLESIPDFPPGVMIQSSDKRLYYNNTLDARLSGAKQRLGGELYSRLFREGG
jgi:vacuolar-type H+-ATPase subunit E/Vma4